MLVITRADKRKDNHFNSVDVGFYFGGDHDETYIQFQEQI